MRSRSYARTLPPQQRRGTIRPVLTFQRRRSAAITSAPSRPDRRAGSPHPSLSPTRPPMPNAPHPSLRALPGHAARSARSQPPRPDPELVELVLAARAGDSSAWNTLIGRFDGMLRSIARSYRLAPQAVDDVVQTTWPDLLPDIARLPEPVAIAGWLATATRRKAMRLLQMRVREQLTDDVDVGDRPDLHGPEATVLARELRAVLARALATLPDRHRRLMTLLLTQPTLDYQEISARLAMPAGSIGPIRARSLARLSRDPQLRALREDAGAGPGAIGWLSAAATSSA